MRLNDKHLMAFANGTAPIDKEGHLTKRGEMNRAFQKRYFILKGNLLYYFEKKGDTEPIGIVILEGCTVELSESSDAFTFELVFQGSGSRTYVLAAESQSEMEDWMKAIACAGYDYMKLMVAELQRQLDDLTMDKIPITAATPPDSDSSRINDAEGLLVDLSVPGSETPPQMRQQSTRRNPFNAGVDLFGATPLHIEVSDGVAASKSNRARTFAEMHRDVGLYINQKLEEGQIKSGSLD